MLVVLSLWHCAAAVRAAVRAAAAKHVCLVAVVSDLSYLEHRIG